MTAAVETKKKTRLIRPIMNPDLLEVDVAIGKTLAMTVDRSYERLWVWSLDAKRLREQLEAHGYTITKRDV